jgi:hypothetical protein
LFSCAQIFAQYQSEKKKEKHQQRNLRKLAEEGSLVSGISIPPSPSRLHNVITLKSLASTALPPSNSNGGLLPSPAHPSSLPLALASKLCLFNIPYGVTPKNLVVCHFFLVNIRENSKEGKRE